MPENPITTWTTDETITAPWIYDVDLETDQDVSSIDLFQFHFAYAP